jgi:choline kinase
MTCVILAAGISSRLYPLTASTPKCLLEVGKYTILERTIRNVHRQGLSRLIIVTGFHAMQIVDSIKKTFPALDVRFVHNERYNRTNNAYSLALTRSSLGSDAMLLLDSDIIFDGRVLSKILNSPCENCLAVRTRGEWDDEEVKVTVDDQKLILRIGKAETGTQAYGESIGIEKFSSAAAQRLYDIIERRVFKEGHEEEFYEASFQQLIESGTELYAVDVGDLPCIEIDTLEDLESARKNIVPQLGSE